MLIDLLNNHRGPYRFCVTRPDPKRDGMYRSQWLPGSIDKEDVLEEAHALLTDPRDTIVDIAVFSESEQCGVTVLKFDDVVAAL